MNTDKYQIWIEASGQKLCLPVNPPKIELKMQGNNKSMTLAELGETVIPQAPRALTLAFSSFFPAKSYPFCDYGISSTITMASVGDYNGDGIVNVRDLAAAARDNSGSGTSLNVTKVMPHYYINFLENAMKSKAPVRVYITGCDFIRYMTVESFTYSQKGGEVGNYDYTLSFKEYREVSVRQVEVKNGKVQLPRATEKRVNTQKKPSAYTVQKGDLIYTIAKKFYGDIADYRKIYNANKKIIGSNPNNIRVGIVLTLP